MSCVVIFRFSAEDDFSPLANRRHANPLVSEPEVQTLVTLIGSSRQILQLLLIGHGIPLLVA